ncbi:MAG: hypothetical protein AAGG01_18260 [Planctomycetota bacterium]
MGSAKNSSESSFGDSFEPRVWAGIDEAGYGPLLGPLTFGFSAFADDAASGEIHWNRLHAAISDAPREDARRIVVADSKKVFTRNDRGRRRLETTAIAFLRAAGKPAASAADLLASAPTGLAPTSEDLIDHPWYSALPGTLPAHVEPGALEERCGSLARALDTAGASVAAAGAVVIPAGKLNASFAATGNKGATLWSFNSKIIAHLFESFGQKGLHLTVDRLGGRARYGRLLSGLIPFSTVHVERESRIESVYRVEAHDRRMRIRFIQKGDTLSMPVALGSCLAKYAREMVMGAFNEHFAAACPDVKPTAGYVTDARRWLADVEAKAPSLLAQPDSLIRTR